MTKNYLEPHLIHHALKSLDVGEAPRVGAITKLMREMSPENQQAARQIADLYREQRELGKHGDQSSVSRSLGQTHDQDYTDRLMGALEADDITQSLIERMASHPNPNLRNSRID